MTATQASGEAGDHSLILDCLRRGQYQTAMDIYERGKPAPAVLLRFLKFAFFNRLRSQIGSFVHRHINELAPADRAYALSKVINLAEMDGDLPRLATALKELDSTLVSIANSGPMNAKDARSLASIALGAFQIRNAEAIVSKAPAEGVATVATVIAIYKAQCQVAGCDPHQLDHASASIASHTSLRAARATVVVRVTPKIWTSVTHTDDPVKLADGLQFAHFLRTQGYNVDLAPQFALPGPSLMAPYSAEQSYPIAFVDQHKYSTRSDIFIHIKSTHSKKVLVDRRGYSGWAEIQKAPELHPFGRGDKGKAKAYCDQERQELFGDLTAIPNSFSAWGRFGVIPLQMPGDSVQLLSRFSFREMIEASITFLHERGLSAVIRKHPLCKDPELATYVSSLSRRSGVFVAEENTRQIILHSEVVLLCNSSVGWDAILAHKPLICFGEAESSRVAYQINDLADLFEAPELNTLVDAAENDKFFAYFWQSYVSGSRKGTLRRIQDMLSVEGTS